MKKRGRAVAAAVLAALLIAGLPAGVYAEESSGVWEDFAYMRSSTGVVITKYRGSDADVVVPDQIEGVHVQAVGTEAFAWNPRVERVTLPEPVRFIGLQAFVGCEQLEQVDWPAQLLAIGRSAFEGCTSLQSTCLPPGTLLLGESAFSGCTALEELVLPKSVYDIGPMAFNGCTGLRRATVFGDATTGTIFSEDMPFAGCDNLEQFAYGGSREMLDEILPAAEREMASIFLIEHNEIGESVEVRTCLTPPGDLVIPAEIGGARLASFADGALASDVEFGRIFYLGSRVDWDRVEIGQDNTPLSSENVICLKRGLGAAPLSPYWNEAEALVTGISVPDLAGMPLRGIDLAEAAWEQSDPGVPPEATVTPTPKPSDATATASPGAPDATATSSLDTPDATATPAPAAPELPDAATPAPAPDKTEVTAPDLPELLNTETASESDPADAAVYQYTFCSAEGEELSVYSILGTGSCVIRLDLEEKKPQRQEAQVVVAGDITGSGIMNIAQLVRMARALNGEAPLEGPYLMAADLDGSGAVDIADLAREAAWLVEYSMPARLV